MTNKFDQQTTLPIKRSLQPVYLASSLIAILMAVVSVVGLTNQDLIYSSEELVQGFLPNDIANLVIGLPILIGCMWAARRGRLAGLLCWPGALIFVIYNYLAYVYAIPLNWALLGYLSLVVLSIYSLFGLVVSIDQEAVSARLTGKVPEKFAGGVLTGFGALFLLRVFLEIGGTLTSGESMPAPELAANMSDFFTSPMLIIGGILLWRRKSLGYLAGLGLLFQASMLFTALVLFLVVQPVLTNAPFALVDVVLVLVMGLVCFVPFGLYLRGVAREG